MENPIWTEEAEAAFLEIKATLGQAPALGLPNIEKPFNLFVHEKVKVILKVLTQTVGPWPWQQHTCCRGWTRWWQDGHCALGH